MAFRLRLHRRQATRAWLTQASTRELTPQAMLEVSEEWLSEGGSGSDYRMGRY
jgi:hypothetical protein